jgi:hypothetical protein
MMRWGGPRRAPNGRQRDGARNAVNSHTRYSIRRRRAKSSGRTRAIGFHCYTGHDRALADVTAGWLDSLPVTQGAPRRRWWSGRQREH